MYDRINGGGFLLPSGQLREDACLVPLRGLQREHSCLICSPLSELQREHSFNTNRIGGHHLQLTKRVEEQNCPENVAEWNEAYIFVDPVRLSMFMMRSVVCIGNITGSRIRNSLRSNGFGRGHHLQPP